MKVTSMVSWLATSWFFTQEACRWAPITGVGPARARGYAVLDDDKGNFWTEFRRFGGVDVLGYPVSQPYHYPVGSPSGGDTGAGVGVVGVTGVVVP